VKTKLLALYPGTTFTAALAIGIVPFLVPGYWDGFAAFALAIAFGFAVGLGRRLLKTVRNSLMILVMFMLVIRSAFGRGVHVYWQWGNLKFTQESVAGALSMVSCVLALGTALLLFFIMTPVKSITATLENAGLPRSGSYVVLSAIQMIPELRKRSTTIMNAQATRGVETEGGVLVRARAFVPILGPLLLSSLTETEERVITLESRAFTAAVPKTRLYEVVKTTPERWAQIALLGVILAALALRIVLCLH
jgi:cobalt/nickel transport system permease protein/energy-coupling factor transport system permease protein